MGNNSDQNDSIPPNRALKDFKKTYDDFFSRMLLFITKLTGDYEQSRDLTADVFIKLWENWNTLESEAHIKSWLYITAKNTALSWISISKRRSDIRKEVSQQLEPTDQPNERQQEQAMILAELMKEIYQQARDLPPQSKQVFDLIYIEGKSTGEIASIMEIAPKTVLNYKLIIIQKLRTILLQKGLITSCFLLGWCRKIFL